MKAVLDLPASLLRKARAAARKQGTTIEKIAVRGFRLALAEEPPPKRQRKPTATELEAWLEKEREFMKNFRVPMKDPRSAAELVSAMRR